MCTRARVRRSQGGRLPKALEELIGEEAEEAADVEIQIPAHKVKLVVGAGGEKIKFIQKKTKCRIQVRVPGCGGTCCLCYAAGFWLVRCPLPTAIPSCVLL